MNLAISFIAPAEFTEDTMPVPKDPRIRIRAVPPHNTAVLRYGEWTNVEKVRAKTEELRAILARDGWKPVSEFRSAQYNPPWTPSPFRRNEIIVEIERGEP
ncbi:MAG: heme-binding protein [Candidatus Deferrimicrobiaceae bacterium]